MAVVPLTSPHPVDGLQYKVIEWTGLANGDSGAPFVFAGRFRDITVQVYGTFGTGGSIDIKGTNETVSPSNWETIRDALDPNATDLDAITAAFAGVMGENFHQIYPNVTAGDGTTSLTVRVCMREY